MTKAFWLALALSCGAGLAQAAEQTITLAPTAAEFPLRIGPMHLQGEPHKFDPPSLGVSYQYSGNGLSLTLYVYDAGIENIPDGGDTVQSCMQFEQAKQDVLAAGYGGTRLKSQQLARLAPPADWPLAREAVFEFQRDGQPTISYLWLTAVGKHFVKLRFSVNAQLRDELSDARHAVLSALGTAIGPHLLPVDPGAKEKNTTINLNAGSESVEDMSTGILYLAILSTLADKSSDQAPVCGGEFIPSFESDVSLYRALFTFEPKGEASPLVKQLMRADEAGYLDELVWVEAHRDIWGETVPEGLALGDYKQWKKKNLERFRMDPFGGVTVGRPRPLPLEAADAP
jgi:hypothetical protein